jgi:hypothetical protein
MTFVGNIPQGRMDIHEGGRGQRFNQKAHLEKTN